MNLELWLCAKVELFRKKSWLLLSLLSVFALVCRCDGGIILPTISALRCVPVRIVVFLISEIEKVVFPEPFGPAIINAVFLFSNNPYPFW